MRFLPAHPPHAAAYPPPIRRLGGGLLAILLVCLAACRAGATTEEAPPEELHIATEAADSELVFAAILAELKETRTALQSRVAARPDPVDVDRTWDDVVEALARGGARLREAMSTGADAAAIDALALEVSALNDLRIEVLQAISPPKRERVLGLSREGIEQLVSEIRHLALVAEWYPGSRLRQIERLPTWLSDVSAVGSATWTLLRILVASLLALWIHRRHRPWIQALRQWLLGGQRNRRLRLGAARALGHLAALGTELVILVWLLTVRDLAAEGAPFELSLAGAVAIAWAWYRLCRAALYRFIASAAVRATELGAEHRRRVLGSIDLVGRYVLGVAIFLLLSASLLGRGYLHTVVVDFAWIGALPIGVALVHGWQAEISGAWIATHPTGFLTSWFERTAGTRQGVIPALAAVGSVVGSGTASWLRDRALRFDQTRSALAWLFRRRLERHAEAVGRGVKEVHALPVALRDAFREEPIEVGPLAVDHWPLQDEVAALAEQLSEGGSGGAVALVGDRGAGKTSWLRALAARVETPRVSDSGEGLETTAHTFAERLTTPEELHRVLAAALGLTAHDEETLVAALLAGPRRLVLLDGCEHLVLRCVGGFAAAEALFRLSSRTDGRILWVCSFGRHGWGMLHSMRLAGGIFREVVQLPPWSEEQIGDAIQRRMEAAGCVAVWDDLLEERLDGGTLETEVLRTSERYRRLLWDHSGGNPRVALHFWLRSLVPDGAERVRVRLFEAPSAAALDLLDDDRRFLLASVVLHGTLTAAEAARTLREPLADCQIRLASLEREGWLGAAAGRYAVTTHWYREVLRQLRRKHLLAA